MKTSRTAGLFFCVFLSLSACRSVLPGNSTPELVNGVSVDTLESCIELSNDMQQNIREGRIDNTQEILRKRREIGCDEPSVRYATALIDLNEADNQRTRFYRLRTAAKTAFEDSKIEYAEEYARELLLLSEQYADDWNYGNAIHDGNMVLGRVALANDQVDQAKEYLLLAGRTPGSPQLNSFGPNLNLANDLLLVGETEIVVEYLELCKEFWNGNPVLADLESWIVLIRGGIIPKFGANLSF